MGNEVATTSYERNDIEHIGDYSQKAILAMKKVVDPVFESRSDFDIFADIAERLGAGKEFTEGKDEMEWIEGFYNDARKQAPSKDIKVPKFKEFWKEGVLEFDTPESAKEYVRYADYREDPLLEPLGTPTGKIEIFSRNIEKMGYDDCGPHPMWMEPVERLGGNQPYPLHIDSAHPNDRLHSQLCGTKIRQNYTVAGREPCTINPEDAKARNIADGDVVRVFNDRGQVLAGAIVSDDIRPSVILLHEGGWYDPVKGGEAGSLDAYGDVNCLTVGNGTSKLAQGNCGHTGLADVEKFTGDLPDVNVFTEPKEV